jgi:glucose-6-phosphate dehydrogenase assembly protein OpcA
MIHLANTNAAEVAAAINHERHRAGSPTVGMVMTLLVITDELHQADALMAASGAAREHPMRIIGLIERPGRGEAHMDANIQVGGDDGAGEVIACRLHGELAAHAGSVAIPLLLPDTPVVAWWPSAGPHSPVSDTIGRHAQRRITDTVDTAHYLDELGTRLANYAPGDTDLTWTRTTPWRAMLAAALDQPVGDITSVVVQVEPHNPSGVLLAGWLHTRLQVPTRVTHSQEPGISKVVLTTTEGEVCLQRPDGRVGELTVPGMPPAIVALPRRSLAELLSEELRRLDPDEVYLEALQGVQAVVSNA